MDRRGTPKYAGRLSTRGTAVGGRSGLAVERRRQLSREHLQPAPKLDILTYESQWADTGNMDPFDARQAFTKYLGSLNAHVASSQKVAHFALKNREHDEDLHSCILEQIERVSFQHQSVSSVRRRLQRRDSEVGLYSCLKL